MRINPDLDEAQELFKQIALGKRLLTVETALLEKSRIDSKYTPTDELLAKTLGITVEQVKELREFAHNELGEVERDLIYSGMEHFLDGEGNMIGKGGYTRDEEEL